MTGGEASKLSGALQWSTQFIFRRLGRALIVPIFKQIRSRSSRIGAELDLALRWWHEVLCLGIAEERPWVENASKPVHIFADARSTPPRIAAVLIRQVAQLLLEPYPAILFLCREGAIEYCDIAPCHDVLASFRRSGDNQIVSLELLSIALGAYFRKHTCPCILCIGLRLQELAVSASTSPTKTL